MPESITPTPTTVLIPGVPAEPTAEITPPPPTAGEIELRFTDAMTQKECTAHFPFEIVEEGGLRKLSGSGILDCHCEIEQWDFAPVPDGTRVPVNHEVALHGWIKSAGPVLMPTALGKVEGDWPG